MRFNPPIKLDFGCPKARLGCSDLVALRRQVTVELLIVLSLLDFGL